VKTEQEIRKEIETLNKWAKDYDTSKETVHTILAVGAHDALLWVLDSRSRRSMSEKFEEYE